MDDGRWDFGVRRGNAKQTTDYGLPSTDCSQTAYKPLISTTMLLIHIAAAIVLLNTLAVPPAAIAAPELTVPVHFYIVDDLVMRKDGLEMRSWVSAADIERDILPEVNRIWGVGNDTGIRFDLDGVSLVKALDPPDRERLVQEIVASRRGRDGKADPARIQKLGQLIDFSTDSPTAINIYLVPYLGEGSQGHTKRRQRRILVGQWSDKKETRGSPPQRCALTENPPMVKGSLSRTVAHELGHMLGLKHPDKSAQTEFELLMGGRRPGYRLTATEIETARRNAATRSQP